MNFMNVYGDVFFSCMDKLWELQVQVFDWRIDTANSDSEYRFSRPIWYGDFLDIGVMLEPGADSKFSEPRIHFWTEDVKKLRSLPSMTFPSNKYERLSMPNSSGLWSGTLNPFFGMEDGDSVSRDHLRLHAKFGTRLRPFWLEAFWSADFLRKLS